MKTYQTGAGSSASSGKDSDAASGGGGSSTCTSGRAQLLACYDKHELKRLLNEDGSVALVTVG